MQRYMVTCGSAQVLVGCKPDNKPMWADVRESGTQPILYDALGVQAAVSTLTRMGYKVWEIEIQFDEQMAGFNPK